MLKGTQTRAEFISQTNGVQIAKSRLASSLPPLPKLLSFPLHIFINSRFPRIEFINNKGNDITILMTVTAPHRGVRYKINAARRLKCGGGSARPPAARGAGRGRLTYLSLVPMWACSFSRAALKSATSATTSACSATRAGYATNLPLAAGGGIDSSTFSFPFAAAAAGGTLISPAHTRRSRRHRHARLSPPAVAASRSRAERWPPPSTKR
jgi:hypothetical protein